MLQLFGESSWCLLSPWLAHQTLQPVQNRHRRHLWTTLYNSQLYCIRVYYSDYVWILGEDHEIWTLFRFVNVYKKFTAPLPICPGMLQKSRQRPPALSKTVPCIGFPLSIMKKIFFVEFYNHCTFITRRGTEDLNFSFTVLKAGFQGKFCKFSVHWSINY